MTGLLFIFVLLAIFFVGMGLATDDDRQSWTYELLGALCVFIDLIIILELEK